MPVSRRKIDKAAELPRGPDGNRHATEQQGQRLSAFHQYKLSPWRLESGWGASHGCEEDPGGTAARNQIGLLGTSRAHAKFCILFNPVKRIFQDTEER